MSIRVRTSAQPSVSRSAATRSLTRVERSADIPEEMTDAEAADFYDTHELSPNALAELPDVTHEFTGRLTRTRPISIRFPEQMLSDLKEVAQRKGVAYQALIKVWVDERLQRERRQSQKTA